MDVLQNMMLLSELVQCGGNVYTWCYDAQGVLLSGICDWLHERDNDKDCKYQSVYDNSTL